MTVTMYNVYIKKKTVVSSEAVQGAEVNEESLQPRVDNFSSVSCALCPLLLHCSEEEKEKYPLNFPDRVFYKVFIVF